jgi:putative transposase
MSQSLSKILVHIVFSTKKRQSWLTNEINDELFPYIAKVIKNNKCYAYEIGGVTDHIHILCSLAKTVTASALIEEIKTTTSRLIKTKNETLKPFFWQHGYGIFSISPAHLNIVRSYILGQAEHHKKITFEDELRTLLKKYNIEYDERYLWD